MFINIFSDIKNFMNELLSKFSWGNVVILFTGIIIGFLICAIVYLVILLISLKKNDNYTHESDAQIKDEEIKRIIRNAHNQYLEKSAYLSTAQKITEVKNISWELINDIARKYYPSSNYPLYELSIDEIMILNHYITDRVNQLFQGKILKGFRKIKISQILKLIDIKKKLDENKVVKAANKAKIPEVMKVTLSVLNVFNPGYWVKKLMINTTLSIGTNKLATLIIDIVGEETTKVYSKSVFNVEKVIESDVEKTITELEENLDSGNQ